jgi:hypothetical protein
VKPGTHDVASIHYVRDSLINGDDNQNGNIADSGFELEEEMMFERGQTISSIKQIFNSESTVKGQ